MWDIQSVEQHVLRDREDGGVCADTERQRSHGDGCESRVLTQDSQRVAQVRPELVPPTQAKRSAHLLLVFQRRSKGDPCLPRSLLGRETRLNQVVFEEFKMAS